MPWASPGVVGRRRIGPVFSLPTLPVAFYADLWPFRVFRRRPLVQGGSTRGGEASAPLALSDRRRNLAKGGHLRSGLRTHVFSSPIEVVSGEGESAMEARRCQAATVGSASGESAPATA